MLLTPMFAQCCSLPGIHNAAHFHGIPNTAHSHGIHNAAHIIQDAIRIMQDAAYSRRMLLTAYRSVLQDCFAPQLQYRQLQLQVSCQLFGCCSGGSSFEKALLSSLFHVNTTVQPSSRASCRARAHGPIWYNAIHYTVPYGIIQYTTWPHMV